MAEVCLLGKRNTEASLSRSANIQKEKHDKALKPHAGSRALSWGTIDPSTAKPNSSGIVGASWLVHVNPRWQWYTPESANDVEKNYTRFRTFGKAF